MPTPYPISKSPFPGWMTLTYNPLDCLEVNDVITYQEPDAPLVNPDSIQGIAVGEHGVKVYGYAGSHMSLAKDLCPGTWQFIIWRKTKERIYIPSIFAEPVPLP